VDFRHPAGRPLVVGHRGAAAVAPENTLAGLEAAVAAGADLVEFDVDRGLVVRHPGQRPTGLTLAGALDFLGGTEIGIHLDLKLHGAESEIAALVEARGLAERTVVSTTSTRSLRSFARDAPAIARAISYPRDRTGAGGLPWPSAVVRGSVATVRPYVLARIPRLLAAGRAGALSVHHNLVTEATVRVVHGRGAALIAWTVNDPARIAVLAGLNVDAIVSDDPGMARDVLARLSEL
jgi:glycerophosphoryl diester phosphodiesterase